MPDYDISRLGDAEADAILECDVVSLAGDYIATVARNHNGHLELSNWKLEPSGELTLVDSTESDSVAGVAATTPDGDVVVAAAYTTHNAHLTTYSWAGNSFQGQASGVKTAHQPSIASFNRMLGYPGPDPPSQGGDTLIGAKGYLVVTACSDETFQLTITAWMAFWGQAPFMGMGRMASWRHGDSRIPSIVAARTADDSNGNLASADVIVAFQDTNNHLKLGTWRVHVAGGQDASIEKIHETGTSEAILEVAAAVYSQGANLLLATAVVTTDGNLKIICWSVNSDGTFTRLADHDAGAADALHCALVRDNVMVTAMRDSVGHLELIYWELPGSPSGHVVRKGTAHAPTLGTYGAVAVTQRRGGAGANDLGETIAAGCNPSGKLKLVRWKVTAANASSARNVGGKL